MHRDIPRHADDVWIADCSDTTRVGMPYHPAFVLNCLQPRLSSTSLSISSLTKTPEADG